MRALCQAVRCSVQIRVSERVSNRDYVRNVRSLIGGPRLAPLPGFARRGWVRGFLEVRRDEATSTINDVSDRSGGAGGVSPRLTTSVGHVLISVN